MTQGHGGAVRTLCCDDADGAPLLCFLCAERKQLTALRVTCCAETGAPVAAVPLFNCDALDAAPLVATRRSLRAPRGGSDSAAAPRAPLDLLLLSHDGALSLRVGAAHVCDCALPAPATLHDGSTAPSDLAVRTPAARAMSPATAAPPAATLGSDSGDCDMDLQDAPTPEPAVGGSVSRLGAAVPATPQGVLPTTLPRSGVVGLRDACGTRVTALLADGSSLRYAARKRPTCTVACNSLEVSLLTRPAACRLELPLAPLSPLVGTVLAAFAHVLPTASSGALTRAYYESTAATGEIAFA